VVCWACRDDLKSVLAKGKSNLQVGLLLESIQLTTEFEREMSRKFGLQQYESIAALSAISMSRTGPPGPISAVFEPYLSIFVDTQDK